LLDRASLFLHGYEADPYRLLRGPSEISATVAEYRAAGIECDLTVWNKPIRRREDSDRFGALVDLAAQLGTRIDFDREMVVRRETDADRRRMAAALRGSGVAVRLNDYAYVQRSTVKLARLLRSEGIAVTICPQAYSVDDVSYLGPAKRHPRPGDTHWPGVTQMAAMRPNAWGQLASDGFPVEIGLASYKQRWRHTREMDAATSIRTQVQAALMHSPAAIGFWHGESLAPGATVRSALEALKNGN
jgi:hypothetical protein